MKNKDRVSASEIGAAKRCPRFLYLSKNKVTNTYIKRASSKGVESHSKFNSDIKQENILIRILKTILRFLFR